MLLTGAPILSSTKNSILRHLKNEVCSGTIAIVAVYGIAWMAETMSGAHMSENSGVLGNRRASVVGAGCSSPKVAFQTRRALAAIVPVALKTALIRHGTWLQHQFATLLHPADYPSDLAAIQFDRSGTTHIGRFVINHSLTILPVYWCERIVRLRAGSSPHVMVLSNALLCRP